MAALPYIQLYVADYLADTSHLNAAQHGAYLLLLMNYWQRGKALPDVNDRLAIVARMSNDEWTANRETLAEFFEITPEGWFHKRIERDLLKVKGISNAGKIAGMASAKARKERALNDRSTVAPTKAQRKGNHTDTDTDTDTDTKEALSTLVRPANAESTNETPKALAVRVVKPKADCEAIYAAYPRKVGHKAAITAIEKAFARLTSANGEGNYAFVPDEANAFLAQAAAAFARSPAGCAGEYTPHPATWFNQSRYLDDPSEWQLKGQNNGNLSKTESSLNAASEAIAIFAARSASGYYDGAGEVRRPAAGQISAG